ncbi:hypothetical protein MUP01_10200 [Candidatus Bathyarchaeota archaeon]|nr:hypothetical protein [Candidatus Bathyarchaeota archaeon]
MIKDYIERQGQPIDSSLISIKRAKSFIEALHHSPYAELVEARRREDNGLEEFIIVSVEVEVGQYPKHDIRPREPIGIGFSEKDKTYPEVVSLRDDFPAVSHLNLRDEEFPRSLCLYQEPWPEIKLQWTGMLFLERIRRGGLLCQLCPSSIGEISVLSLFYLSRTYTLSSLQT